MIASRTSLRKFAAFAVAVTILGLASLTTVGCGDDATESGTGSGNDHGPAVASTDPTGTPAGNQVGDEQDATQPDTRHFEFHYDVVINNLKPGQVADIWIPVAESSPHQDVQIIDTVIPGDVQSSVDELHGNKVLYFQATATDQGEIPVSVTYDVTRYEVTAANYERLMGEDFAIYLQADQLVPVGGRPQEMLLSDGVPSGEPLAIARHLYNKVDDHVRYDKPEGGGWGRGDAVWVCDSQHGNCTDFHSLFISLCRTSNIPGRFEIGFPLPPDESEGSIGGYHCWAVFLDGDQWVPVDISEADKHPEMKEYYFGNLTADRVTFTIGRDLVLSPPTQTGPVNYLVYPHVEVDGELHTSMDKRFSFADLP